MVADVHLTKDAQPGDAGAMAADRGAVCGVDCGGWTVL